MLKHHERSAGNAGLYGGLVCMARYRHYRDKHMGARCWNHADQRIAIRERRRRFGCPVDRGQYPA